MRKISIYQVLPRLFGNQSKNPIPNGIIEENGCGKFNDFTDKALTEIKKLGITHIWYTGILRHATTTNYLGLPAQDSCIVKGKAGSPYAITDYYDVMPDLAVEVDKRMQEFDDLLNRTKKQGLKSIIDFIPNHVSRDYKSLKKPKSTPDLASTDDSSKHFDKQNNFYYLPNESLKLNFCENQKYEEFPAKVSGNDCFHSQPNINDWYETIKLNYGVDVQNNHSKHFSPTPNTWFRMLEILQFWAQKGVDGFRCDMVEMVPVEFWEWAIPQIKEINPEIIFIGEVYQPLLYESYIKQGKFDYLYDKVGLYDKLKQIIRGESHASEISYIWQGLQGLDKHLLRFLENHDEQRIPSNDFAGDATKAIPAMLLSATMHQGPILTYFGQEFGENNTSASGFSGNDGRTTIFDYWTLASIQRWRGKSAYNDQALLPQEKELQKEYKKILNLSIQSDIIADGDFYDLMWANKDNHHFFHNKAYAFMRSYKEKALLIVINFSDTEINQNIIIPEHAFQFANKKTNRLKDISFINIFMHEEIRMNYQKVVHEGLSIKIPAYNYVVFEF
jgi:glycosidase